MDCLRLHAWFHLDNGALELNPSLVLPILEMLLGGNGKASGNIQREVTEIERPLSHHFERSA